MVEYFFFFQAEDGIRDKLVTGVQTCALPIYNHWDFFLLNENWPHGNARRPRQTKPRGRYSANESILAAIAWRHYCSPPEPQNKNTTPPQPSFVRALNGFYQQQYEQREPQAHKDRQCGH